MLNKILIILVLILTFSTAYLFYKSQEMKFLGGDAYSQEQKCLSWSVYNPDTRAWRWRAETLNEYFPSKEEAVMNCVAMLNVVKNQ
jgi:hypothetical protein